ncbi:hypothetical protein B0H16DRAFT_1735569 [Mycena metata]|uniref:Uncharacterized protein n=1 Tax=Mycena metata TaxID=1033252 RepID=A0AAD7HRK3_9AGAR|nr:hypothetical protein B0H16DRAFT_1735569 [Mycena metata]
MSTVPAWGPSAQQLAMCMLDAHEAAQGDDRHYGTGGGDEDDGDDAEAEGGGEEEHFGTLELQDVAAVWGSPKLEKETAGTMRVSAIFTRPRKETRRTLYAVTNLQEGTRAEQSIARGRWWKALSPLPPSSPPPPSPPPPSSSPPRSPSPLSRASSPELPASIMLQPITDPALRRTQEAARKRFNRKIVKLKKKLAQNPDNAVWQVKLEHALQDYKEEWGDFIADKHAKKFAAKRDRLLKARQLARADGGFIGEANESWGSWALRELPFYGVDLPLYAYELHRTGPGQHDFDLSIEGTFQYLSDKPAAKAIAHGMPTPGPIYELPALSEGFQTSPVQPNHLPDARPQGQFTAKCSDCPNIVPTDSSGRGLSNKPSTNPITHRMPTPVPIYGLPGLSNKPSTSLITHRMPAPEPIYGLPDHPNIVLTNSPERELSNEPSTNLIAHRMPAPEPIYGLPESPERELSNKPFSSPNGAQMLEIDPF